MLSANPTSIDPWPTHRVTSDILVNHAGDPTPAAMSHPDCYNRSVAQNMFGCPMRPDHEVL